MTEKPDILRTLSEEELAKVEPLTEDQINEALRKGAEEAREARENLPLPRRWPGRFL